MTPNAKRRDGSHHPDVPTNVRAGRRPLYVLADKPNGSIQVSPVDDGASPRAQDALRIPYDEGTEAALIGAVVLLPDWVLDDVVATGLRPEHFYVPRYRAAWEAVLMLLDEGEPVDIRTVNARLENKRTVPGAVEEAAVSTMSHAPAWAKVIISDSRARAAQRLLGPALRAAGVGDVDLVVVLVHQVLDAVKAAPG